MVKIMGFPHWLFHCELLCQSAPLVLLKLQAPTTLLYSGGDALSLLGEVYCMPARNDKKWVNAGEPKIR